MQVHLINYGEMREWLKRTAYEAAVPFGVSGVRIPLSFEEPSRLNDSALSFLLTIRLLGKQRLLDWLSRRPTKHAVTPSTHRSSSTSLPIH